MNKYHVITHLIGIVIIVALTACSGAKTPIPPKNLTFTFSTDMQCSVQGPKSIHPGENTVDMVGNIQNHGKVGLAVATLDSVKTIKDIQEWPSTIQPAWLTIITFLESPSDGTTYTQTFNVSPENTGPVYFVCFSEIPEAKIGALGPYEVKE